MRYPGDSGLDPDARTIVDGSPSGRTAVGLWELPG